MVVDVDWYLALSAILFVTGVMGVLLRRNVIIILMSVELMLNAVNINLVAFQDLFYKGDPGVTGQIFALFIITVAAGEVGVGLAIVLNMFRNRATVNVDDVDLMRW